ncbi:hypothetical protein [Fusobacterium russii]|uniref:hypothetical protein n=1 Tax=Fusobacterium russii TaxID=854 RepID=UPI0003A51832|nr:hypothetical protein [Fusobacterium russii]
MALAVATYTSGLLPTNTGGKIKFQPEYAYATSTVGALEISKPTFSVIAKEVAGGMKSGSVYAIVGKNLLENTERDNLKEIESSSKTPEAKKGGRLGKEETRLQNKEIAELGESLDWKHIGGAGRKEEYIEALNKVKGSSKGGK